MLLELCFPPRRCCTPVLHGGGRGSPALFGTFPDNTNIARRTGGTLLTLAPALPAAFRTVDAATTRFDGSNPEIPKEPHPFCFIAFGTRRFGSEKVDGVASSSSPGVAPPTRRWRMSGKSTPQRARGD